MAQLGAQVQFHHLTLNTTDPAAAIAFYTSRFDCERATYAGHDAVRAGKNWLLFNKVAKVPESSLESSVWHFGWGAEDMPAAYAAQLAKGTPFDTPLTDISDLARVPNFYYAYVKGPDGALIEMNTAAHHRFGHLHLFSADPVAAGEWWAKHFGVKARIVEEKRLYRDFPVAPSASFALGDVSVIIYPKAGPLVSTKGRVVDHVGLAVEDLRGTLKRLRAAGVTVDGDFLEGPDKLRIQLVQQ